MANTLSKAAKDRFATIDSDATAGADLKLELKKAVLAQMVVRNESIIEEGD